MPPPRSNRLRAILVFALKLAAAGAMFAWLFSRGLLDARAFVGLSTTSLLAGFLLVGVQGMGNAVRLYWLFKRHGLPVSFARSTSLTWVALAFNQLLPGGAGGDAVRAYYVARDNPHAKGEAIVAVLFDKIIGLAGLLLLGVVPWALAMISGDALPPDAARIVNAVGATMAAGFLICAVIAAVALSPRVDAGAWLARWAEAPAGTDPSRLRKLAARLVGPLASLASVHQNQRIRLLGLVAFSALLHLLSCIALYLLARAAGDTHPFTLHLALWSVAFLTTAIPLSPGGIGVSEAAAGKLWLLCGVTTGAATYLAFRGLSVAQAAIGLGVYVVMRKQNPAIVEMAKREAAAAPSVTGS
jgi:hypothetical protein